jgi:hypothetical protein
VLWILGTNDAHDASPLDNLAADAHFFDRRSYFQDKTPVSKLKIQN